MILFCGDPHGQFGHIIEAVQEHRPAAVILLGDLQAQRPLEIELAPILTSPEIWFFHGNHDTDSEADHDHRIYSTTEHPKVVNTFRSANPFATRKQLPACLHHRLLGAQSGLWVEFLLASVFGEHIAEQCALFDCVVECDVIVRQFVKPVLWHVLFGAVAILAFQHCHGE